VSQFARADMRCGAGLIHAATIFSYEQLIMDCEIYDVIRSVTQGIVIDEDTLAVDVVDRVGPQNHFMTDPHTMKHLRSAWQPTVMDRRNPAQWEADGKPATADHAGKMARELLETHRAPALENEAELLEIIRKIEAGL
ncbi:MAG: trimethylamine methyltransferase family protein, partial [Desulfobacterales bacterium]|nr:trimethylamine methyltransferase family protein [Desulfobacterales bacterium]